MGSKQTKEAETQEQEAKTEERTDLVLEGSTKPESQAPEVFDYSKIKDDLFADFDLQNLGIFMTRVATKEQKATPKITQKNTDFEFGDDFQEAGVLSKPRIKTKSQSRAFSGLSNPNPTSAVKNNTMAQTSNPALVLSTPGEIDLMAGAINLNAPLIDLDLLNPTSMQQSNISTTSKYQNIENPT